LPKDSQRQVQIRAGRKQKISEQPNIAIVGGKMRTQQTTGCDPTHHIRLQASLRSRLLSTVSGGIALAAGLTTGAVQASDSSFSFIPGALVVSSSTYAGTAATVTVCQTLPGGGTAIANGTYPNVVENATVDGSFGVTSPLILREYVLPGNNRSAVLVKTLNVTDRTGTVTSFSSKSELALNLSTTRSALTFMGYKAPINTLDVSNSNPPSHVDPTNPVAASYQRAIVEIDADRSLHVTPVNTYSGNNGRAASLNDSYGQHIYYTAGNAGNGSYPLTNTSMFWRPPASDRFSAVWLSPRAGTRTGIRTTDAVWIDTRRPGLFPR
jgi:hypothetical protein